MGAWIEEIIMDASHVSYNDQDVAAAGFGPQKLATLAAYALRRNLLDWLETFKVEKLCAARLARQREAAAEVGHCSGPPDTSCPPGFYFRILPVTQKP